MWAREFKLRPFSAGSILTLRDRIEPLASYLSRANAAEDAINKTHAVDNCAGGMFLTREAGVSIKTSTPAEMLGWGLRAGA
jgi:hypothetical protein